MNQWGIQLGFTHCLQMEGENWFLGSNPALYAWLHPEIWDGDSSWGRGRGYGSQLASSVLLHAHATWTWKYSVHPSRLPPPTLCEASSGGAGLAGGGLRCSRAEKRCPAVAAMAGHAAGERGAFRGA